MEFYRLGGFWTPQNPPLVRHWFDLGDGNCGEMSEQNQSILKNTLSMKNQYKCNFSQNLNNHILRKYLENLGKTLYKGAKFANAGVCE